MLNNNIEGQGIKKFASGSKYNGSFKNNLFDGFGIYETIDGYKAEGNWLKGQIEGKGKITYPDLSVYNGDLVKGIPNGTGTIYMEMEVIIQEGFNGKIDGFGIAKYQTDKFILKF